MLGISASFRCVWFSQSPPFPFLPRHIIPAIPSKFGFCPGIDRKRLVLMSAASVSDVIGSIESTEVNPPSHPTYDLKGLIRLALEEDAGDRGWNSDSLQFFFCRCFCLFYKFYAFHLHNSVEILILLLYSATNSNVHMICTSLKYQKQQQNIISI